MFAHRRHDAQVKVVLNVIRNVSPLRVFDFNRFITGRLPFLLDMPHGRGKLIFPLIITANNLDLFSQVEAVEAFQDCKIYLPPLQSRFSLSLLIT